MNWLLYQLYIAVVALIRVYKWVELQLLLALTPVLKWKGKQLGKSIGVVFHCPGDNAKNNNLVNGSDGTAGKNKAKSNYNGKILHVNVKDNKLFARWANLGSLAGGETYMEGMWEFIGDKKEDDLVEFSRRVLESDMVDLYFNPWNRFLDWLEREAFNLQTRKRAFQVGLQHYDLGNELYKLMLDPWMQYTCGYWKEADNLNDAQINKMELIARKLDLKPGMRVLDIGCGWGTLCKYLSENYKVECVGITISEEGVAYGQAICKGLPIEIRLQDYREVNEKFDRIVSAGMFEHVGRWNYREYFEVARKCLKDDGIFLLQTIGRNHARIPRRSEPWCEKYIFPNGQVPLINEIVKATHNLFIVEDWHNFSMDYAKTVTCWRDNFIRGWPQIREKYGEGFFKMWTYYLCTSVAFFSSRRGQLWQIVLSTDGLKREYCACR